jgi:spore coat polysaccharide biosynthesis protein SpsF
VGSLEGRPDDTVVVRLTADNPLPDGAFLDELAADFLARRVEYLASNGMPSGLPYGMSAEVTRLRHLREAHALATSGYDREHVTPYIARKFGAAYCETYKASGRSHYRCTIDTYDDYVGMQQLFREEPDPVGVSAFDLIERLDAIPYQPCAPAPVPSLVVGGAQLGMHYGIANEVGMPDCASASMLLKTAIANGVACIDTARAYGCSEAAIGAALDGGWAGRVQVVTKLDPLADCGLDMPGGEVRLRVVSSVYESCVRLRRASLNVLLLHRCEHLHAWDGAAWTQLLALQAQGLVGTLGVSVQSPDELVAAIDMPQVGFVQLPFNLLDWRWDVAIGRLTAARRERAITVHARSALLQGLLPSRSAALWCRANVAAPESVWEWLDAEAKRHGRSGVVDLCLAYLRAQPWIDGVVVGMETVEQLIANIHAFNTPALDPGQVRQVEEGRPRLGVQALDPFRWQKALR